MQILKTIVTIICECHCMFVMRSDGAGDFQECNILCRCWNIIFNDPKTQQRCIHEITFIKIDGVCREITGRHL